MRASQRAIRILEEVTVLFRETKRVGVPAATIPEAWWVTSYDTHRAYWLPGTDHWIVRCGNYTQQYLPTSRTDKIPLSCADVRWLISEIAIRSTYPILINRDRVFKKGLSDEHRSQLVLFTSPSYRKRFHKSIHWQDEESAFYGEIPGTEDS